MAFETYPIPGPTGRTEEVDSRLDTQKKVLISALSKLYGAVDQRLNAQQGALNNVNRKLYRAANGRIKAQGAALQVPAAALYSAVNEAITQQGQQLALQSSLLPRLAAQGAAPDAPTYPSLPGAVPPSTLVVGGGTTPTIPTVPSLPPGVAAPVFPLAPQQVLPTPGPTYESFAPTTTGAVNTTDYRPVITSPQSGGGSDWVVLVDCDKGTADVYDRTDLGFVALVTYGAFVPIRYSTNRESLLYNFLGRGDNPQTNVNAARVAQWVQTACRARNTNGQGWPSGGDFPHDAPGGLDVGYPVGDWPFDSSGNYIGL